MGETLLSPQQSMDELAKHIVVDVCETSDPPATFVEFSAIFARIELVLTHMNVPCISDSECMKLMLQQFLFSWDILNGVAKRTTLDVFSPAANPADDAITITTGYAELNDHIPTHLKVCKYTRSRITEGVVIIQQGKSPFCMSIEACVTIFEEECPKELQGARIVPAGHPDALAAVHHEAVKVLVAGAQRVNNPPVQDLTGHVVEVVVEADKDVDTVEFFLITEYNEATKELFGFWLYKPSEMPGDWDTPSETGSVELDCNDRRVFLSDHFDVVHTDALSKRSVGPNPIPINEVLPNVAGAWSSKHNTAFVGQERVRGFLDMLKTLQIKGYTEAGLRLWPAIYDRVNAVLPSGIDSCLQRAEDLRERLWEGANLEPLQSQVHGLCDCCGLPRRLTFELGKGWYIGKTCAAKIQTLIPEIESCKTM